MKQEYDASEYLGGDYVRKQDLRADGPRRVTIRDVEQSDRLKDKNGSPLLVLAFDDDLRYTLGTKTNIKRLIEAFGKLCSSWLGREIELYYAPDVRGPSGEEGGIRLRVPEREASAPVTVPDVPAVLTNERPAAKEKRGGKVLTASRG